MGGAYSSWERTNVLYATSFVCLGAKAKFHLKNPKVLVVFDDISEICWPQSRSSVMVIPRYLADWTCSNICWCNEYSNLICLSGRYHDTLIEWHLATLNFICQPASHCASRSRSSCKIRQKESICSYTGHNHQQTNGQMIWCCQGDCWWIPRKGLVQGPSLGEHQIKRTGSDACPSSTTCCERLESYELIHLWTILSHNSPVYIIAFCVVPCQNFDWSKWCFLQFSYT